MTNGNPEIILKLFDTLKESTDKNERTMQTLINQQQALVDHVKHMPMKEIRQEIQDHIESAFNEREQIKTKIDTKSETILEKLRTIDTKVVKMIVVVIVAFAIISGGTIIFRALSETTGHSHNEIYERVDERFDQIEKKIEQLHKKP